MKEEGIEKGNQRGALTTCRLVADSEACDGGNASARSEEGAFSHGEGAFSFAFF
jgi:hypothetical protein